MKVYILEYCKYHDFDDFTQENIWIYSSMENALKAKEIKKEWYKEYDQQFLSINEFELDNFIF